MPVGNVQKWPEYLSLFPHLITLCLIERSGVLFNNVLRLLAPSPNENGGTILIPRLRTLEYTVDTGVSTKSIRDTYSLMFTLAANAVELR